MNRYRKLIKYPILLLGFALIGFGTTNTEAKKKGKWKLLKKEAGISVYRRPSPGTSIVEFKGKGAVNASVLDIMAVLGDSSRITEWTACRKFRKVKQINDKTTVFYCQVRAPWPFQDRDFIGRSVFSVDDANRWLHIRSRGIKWKSIPPKKGLVRMPFTRVHWAFKRLAKNRTWVEYSAIGDPGGNIPNWVVNLVSKDIPLKTLKKLRKRLKRPGIVKQSLRNQYKQYEDWGLPGSKSKVATEKKSKPKKKKKKTKKKKKKKKKK